MDLPPTDPVDEPQPARRGWRFWTRRTALPADPPEAPDDPWHSFAPAPQTAPAWYGRLGEWLAERAIALFKAEMTRVGAAGLLIAAGLNWPLVRHLGRVMPGPAGEGTGPAWWLAWLGSAIRSSPSALARTASYTQGQYPDAGTEPLLGYLPLAAVGGGPAAAATRYAVIVVLAGAIAAIGGYALARQLGARPAAAAVAGAGFGYAPLHLGQTDHLGVLSFGVLAMALAALARGHGWSLTGGYRRDRCATGWAVLGWLVIVWLISLGAAVAVPVGYAVAALVLVSAIGWLVRRRPAVPIGLLVVDAIGGFAVGAGAIGMVGLADAVGRVAGSGQDAPRAGGVFASPLSLFTAPERSLLWGSAHSGARSAMADPVAMALLPGFALLAMALAGLVVSAWRWPTRLVMAGAGLGLAVLALALGGRERGSDGALGSVPGLGYVTGPAAAQMLLTLVLAMLAAGACTALGRRARAAAIVSGGTRLARATVAVAGVLPVAVVLAEGLPARTTWAVPRVPAAVARTERYPLMVLPSEDVLDGQATLWGTAGPLRGARFPSVANAPGYPRTEQAAKLRAELANFPDSGSVTALRRRGIRTVVVLRTNAKDRGYIRALTQYDARTLTALGLAREESDEAVVYSVQVS